MKQRTKKLLALLITLAMCMGLMSMPVMADGYAAKIGDAEYATVQEAIDAAQENEEIVVYDATTFPSTLTLSNATIKGAEGASKVKVTTLSTISASNQNLTIENFEFEQSSSTGKLVMDGTGMTIKNCDFAIGDSDPGSGQEGFLTIGSWGASAKNLTLLNCNFDATNAAGRKFYKIIFHGPWCENLTVKGCRFENGWAAFHYGFLSGDVLVEDSYIVEEVYTVHTSTDTHVDSYTIKNSTLGGWTSYAGCDQSTFENCTFVDFSYNTLVAYNNTTFKNCTFPAGYQIYAGSTSSFNWVIDNCTVGGELLYEGDEEKFFASDDTAWKNQTVTITPAKAAPVAQIGNTKYATLAQAVANVKSGETITLLQNAYGDGIIVPENSNFTLDFAGYTYDVDGDKLAGSTGTQTQAFQLLKGSNITFKNGTVTSSKAKMLIQNYCNLTLDNMILDGTKLVGNAPYTLSNNNGNVTIKDTAINAKSGGFAFDVYSFKPYTGANVTVDGGTINGNIEIDAKPDADTTNLGLTINGGKFTGTFNPTTYADNLTITGGIFTADVNAYVADGYTLRAIDDPVYNYEVVKAATADKDYVADKTGAQTAQEIAVSKVEKDLVNNGDSSTVVTAQKKTVENAETKVFNIVTVEKANNEVSATSTKPIKVTGTDNISVDNITLSALGELFAQKVEVLNAVAEPTATLSLSVAAETTTDDAITYEVHPVVTVADNSYPLNGEVVDGTYTFRLTVPEKMAQAYNKIKVAHGNEVQYCDVKSDANGYYIEVKTTHFSTFEVTGVIGISAIDAYIDPQTSNGNIRFLTTVNSADTVSEYGTYFALKTDGIENSNVNRKDTVAGTAFDFDVDILNVPADKIDKTFYAISYVKIGDDTVWSVAVPASVAQYKHN